jgi:protein MAK16
VLNREREVDAQKELEELGMESDEETDEEDEEVEGEYDEQDEDEMAEFVSDFDESDVEDMEEYDGGDVRPCLLYSTSLRHSCSRVLTPSRAQFGSDFEGFDNEGSDEDEEASDDDDDEERDAPARPSNGKRKAGDAAQDGKGKKAAPAPKKPRRSASFFPFARRFGAQD